MEGRSPVTVAGPRRILTGFLPCRRLAAPIPPRSGNGRQPHCDLRREVCGNAHGGCAGRRATEPHGLPVCHRNATGVRGRGERGCATAADGSGAPRSPGDVGRQLTMIQIP
ncbi:hypothetical protein GCM10012280_05100 [Wenjunlia tyrosinilytica]|uniref:Uncharacterized protein n=1 Tax=Wenjunlia tyrosinilytica TaxID=1544741 RepID=A0A918DT55_9ACTN|nr:hypothetical protein GCM10012280_05100 [Wenjunlia tyrosinilytica]